MCTSGKKHAEREEKSRQRSSSRGDGHTREVTRGEHGGRFAVEREKERRSRKRESRCGEACRVLVAGLAAMK